MKKLYLNISLIIILLLSPIIITYAEEVDITKLGSIKIDCKHENNSLKNMNIKIYKIANANQNNGYTYLREFQNKERELSNITTSDLVKYSEELVEFINTNNIEPISSLTTNQEGIGTFNNLQVGLYLLVYEINSNSTYEYKASPVIISIPTIENDIAKYDLEIKPKIETTTINSNDTNNQQEESNSTITTTTTKKTPKTIDNIIKYVALLLISIVGIFIVVLYRIIRRKKEKNEKNI